MSQSIAVFPLLDLTKGTNGVNYVLTEYIRQETEARGYTIVAARDVMDFMVRYRIRTLGKLDSIEITRSGVELNADLILLGTVCQHNKEPGATVSMNLQLIRTSDIKTVWTVTKDLYQADLLTLLGINDPERLGDLYGPFFADVYETFPDNTPPSIEVDDLLEIDSVYIHPQAVRSEEEVQCRVRIKSTMMADSLPEVMIKVNETLYPVIRDEDVHYYTASWNAGDAEGKYAVEFVTEWSTGEHISYILGEYQVDNIPPELEIHFNGPKIGELYAFNYMLTFTTSMLEPEPLTRWNVSIFDKNGILIVYQEAAGQIPQRLWWNGKTSSGLFAPDGEYKIEITIWDKAGWSSMADQVVLLYRDPPELFYEYKIAGDQLDINIDNTVAAPLSFWWLRVYENQGRIVLTSDGEKLPAHISIPLPENEDDSTFDLLIEVRDVLGNKTRQRVQDLIALARHEEVQQEEETESQWLEEF